MKKREATFIALVPALVLALTAILVVVWGARALDRQIRADARERAASLGRQQAYGVTRAASETLWRFRETFTFSLTHLPFERLLAEEEPAPESILALRRFLALNQEILRELVVIGVDGSGRTIRLDQGRDFSASARAPLAEPLAASDTVVISGLVEAPDGETRARVYAVLDPVRFWRGALTAFSLSHPDLWTYLLDERGEAVLVRHGGRGVQAPPVFGEEVRGQLRLDATEAYEGRFVHPVRIKARRSTFVSISVPVRLETWRGLLVVSTDEHEAVGVAAQALALLASAAGLLVVLLLALFLLFTRHTLRDRRQIEEARRRNQALLDTVQSGILLVDERDGRIIEINPAALRLLAHDEARVLGRRVDEFFSPAASASRSPILSGGETHLRDGTGRERVVLANTARFESGGRCYRVCSFVDITPLRESSDRLVRSEAELREANTRLQLAIRDAEQSAREAEAANLAKSSFLAMMSHELRTPLNSILGLSESLQEGIHGALNERQTVYLGLVAESGRHLLDLINDILDLAKVESGRQEFELTPCSLVEICDAAVRVVGPVAARRGQRFVVEPPEARLRVRADPRRLQQVLVNLLGNAVKFTPRGGRLGLRVESDAETLRLVVWDEGIGIAADQLGRIFQPFVQLDARLSRDYGGTGLGLCLVKQLVALHGGRVELSSAPGLGSVFTVVLPRLAGDGTDEPGVAQNEHAHPSSPGRSLPPFGHYAPLVLLAEDTPLNIVPVRDYLEARGCRVAVAENGLLAVTQVMELRPDLVLMDIQMPVLDGLEAIRRIRAQSDTRVARVPIVALTALAMPGDRERCLAAGADDYLPKPASPRKIFECVSVLVRRARAEEQGVAKTEPR